MLDKIWRRMLYYFFICIQIWRTYNAFIPSMYNAFIQSRTSFNLLLHPPSTSISLVRRFRGGSKTFYVLQESFPKNDDDNDADAGEDARR